MDKIIKLMRLVTEFRGIASFCALTIYCERDKYAPVAQLAAQAICNRQVSGFESPLGLGASMKISIYFIWCYLSNMLNFFEMYFVLWRGGRVVKSTRL